MLHCDSKPSISCWRLRAPICWIVLLLFWGALQSLLACKYSVRDVAFVDLDRSGFECIVAADSKELNQLKTSWSPTLKAVLMDTNVRPRWIASDRPETWPSFLAQARVPTGISFHFFEPDLPWLPIPLNQETQIRAGEALPELSWSWAESLVRTERREALVDQLMEAYAVILVVEGTDTQENQRVVDAARRAADFIEELMPRMPKPVEVAPQVVVLDQKAVTSETSLLWSLGMEVTRQKEPQAAILIGRGRRLGPNLQGEAITALRLQEMLAVAGQDCECDLDRSWMQGPRIPMPWGIERQQRAYGLLGFDPENPLVKAEISRILSRGRNPIQAAEAGGLSQGLDMLLLGYSEEVIGIDPVSPEPALDTVIKKPDLMPPSEPVAEAGAAVPESLSPSFNPTIHDDLIGHNGSADMSDGNQNEPSENSAMMGAFMALGTLGTLALLGGFGILLYRRQNH